MRLFIKGWTPPRWDIPDATPVPDVVGGTAGLFCRLRSRRTDGSLEEEARA